MEILYIFICLIFGLIQKYFLGVTIYLIINLLIDIGIVKYIRDNWLKKIS